MSGVSSPSLPPVVICEPADLTLEAFEQIAWDGRAVSLHPALLERLGSARAAMLEALGAGRDVYGVTTGMGYLAGVRLSAEEQDRHQANLLLGRAVGGPPYLDRGEVRAVLLARLAGFLTGHAGVTPELCLFLVDRLNDGFTPAVPRTGVGCAGEIIPLAHAFQTFMGVGEVVSADGRLRAAGEALAERHAQPYRPAVKEGIALLAGAPGALALTASARRAGQTLYRQLLVTWACAIDAMRAPLSAYDPALAQLAGDPLLQEVLARLGDLLQGSDPERQSGQAPVSFRVVPQVLCHLGRTLARLEEDLRRGLTAAGDSPAFVDGRFVTSGGFHAIGLASGIDYLCIALVQAGELAGQQAHRLLDSRFTGLPDQLAPRPGPQAGLVAVQKRAAGALNELRRLAVPATVGLSDTSMGQEDAMTFAFEGREKLRRAESLVREVLACELLVCRQAWAMRPSGPAAGLEEHVRTITAAVPPLGEDRPLGPDIARLRALLGSEALQ